MTKYTTYLLLLITLPVFTVLSTGCKTNTSTAGSTYTCQGTSPFWEAHISSKEISFTKTGSRPLVFPYKPPHEGDSRLVFFTKTTDHTLRVSLERTPCRTSTAGQRHPYRAEIALDGVEYIGCAKKE